MRKVDEYIDQLPPEKAKIAARLRELLIELVPGIEERFSFKIPFYHYFGMFCYINPITDGVNLAICRGKDLLDEFPQLALNGRATIATLSLRSEKDIERFNVREIISTAAIWNEEAKQQKIPIAKKKKNAARK